MRRPLVLDGVVAGVAFMNRTRPAHHEKPRLDTHGQSAENNKENLG